MTIPAMIFAAGKGTRMLPLTADRPKPLIKVGGKALIDHALDLLKPAGPSPVVINLHAFPQQLRDHLTGSGILFSDETDVLRETGGGLRHALPLLGGSPVMTVNADATWKGVNPARSLLQRWTNEMEGLVVLVPRGSAIGHKGKGDFALDAAGRISRGSDYIYTGLQIIRTEGLADFEDRAFSLNLLWDQMIARRGLYGLVWDGMWCDVGQPESIAKAEKMLFQDV